MDDASGDNEDFLYYTQPDQAPVSSFAESAHNPRIDLCTQVAEPEDPPPFCRYFRSSNFGTPRPQRPITPSRSVFYSHFPTDAVDRPPSGNALNLGNDARKLEIGRMSAKKHRDKIKAGKIADRAEIAELASNFAAPNQGWRL